MTEDEKEMIDGQVEVEGFDYAMVECSSSITEDKEFHALRDAFIEARRRLARYLDMEDHL